MRMIPVARGTTDVSIGVSVRVTRSRNAIGSGTEKVWKADSEPVPMDVSTSVPSLASKLECGKNPEEGKWKGIE
jgi:hypothetical protein